MMPMDPFTALVDALRGNPRFVGHGDIPGRILLGAHNLPKLSTPARIVVVPTRGAFDPPEDKDNLTDGNVSIDCHCWGQDETHRWLLVCALVLAVWDYRVSANVDVQHVSVEFGQDQDTTRDGKSAIVTVQMRCPIDKDMFLNPSSATVDNEKFAGDQGTVTRP